MSETYSVWHATGEGPAPSCYVTAINVQELGTADEQFIGQLLEGIGLARSEVSSWSIGDPFLVDHLSSGDSEDWRDLWLITWELTLKGASLGDLPVEPVDVVAWDSSWSGVEATAVSFEVIATRGDKAAAELDVGRPVTRCSLGHAHVSVPTGDDVDAAAHEAAKVEAQYSEAGWSTSWRPAQSPA